MTKQKANALLLVSAAIGLVAVGGCSRLTLFNAIIPKDNGVVRVVANAPFGDDPRQRLDIYRPASSARNLPIIVFFYGGSWNSGSKNGYSWVGRALAARGFVVAIPDYRLVPRARFPAFIEDGAAAVRLVDRLASQFGGDPNRLILAGHSAGAYNAAMLAYDDQWLGKDRARIKGFVGLAGPYDFLPFEGPEVKAAFAGATDLAATQPVDFVDRGDPPAFLALAGEDRTVRPENSYRMADKLRSAGVPVELKLFPRVGHAGLVTAIARPLRGRADVLDEIVAFADKVAATN
jgi:acetyl esterase/lipase